MEASDGQPITLSAEGRLAAPAEVSGGALTLDTTATHAASVSAAQAELKSKFFATVLATTGLVLFETVSTADALLSREWSCCELTSLSTPPDIICNIQTSNFERITSLHSCVCVCAWSRNRGLGAPLPLVKTISAKKQNSLNVSKKLWLC